MNSANFDEWGRMTANLGLEAPGATPLLQNIILYPYVNPATEVLDSTGLPSSLDVTPISSAADGTQIWKITHNGVDTHPIHFHLYDVQVINRVTWDNIIIPPDPTELGLEGHGQSQPARGHHRRGAPDRARRSRSGSPTAIRPLNPMMPIGAQGSQNGPNGTEAGFNNTDANGNPIAPDREPCSPTSGGSTSSTATSSVPRGNGHDAAGHGARGQGAAGRARPVVHPRQRHPRPGPTAHRSTTPTRPAGRNPGTAEVGYRIERAEVTDGVAGAYTRIATALANATTYTDNPPDPTTTYDYRVTAFNAAGDSPSNVITVDGLPKAPTALTAVVRVGAGRCPPARRSR